MRFGIEPKAASLNMRLPAALLDAVKAKASGIPDTRHVRMLLETDLARPKQGGTVRAEPQIHQGRTKPPCRDP